MNDLEESSTTVREVNEPLSGWASKFEKYLPAGSSCFFSAKKNEQKEKEETKKSGKT